jgi:hypothetical protein
VHRHQPPLDDQLTDGGDCHQLELVHGVELDDDAYEQTVGNYDLSSWRGKMRAFHTSFQDYARTFTQPVNEEGAPLAPRP